MDVVGLECGQDYQFRVRAGNEVGKSDWSAPVLLGLAPCPPTPPSRPYVTESDQKEVSCAWYPPQIFGGKAEIQYQVEIISLSPALVEGTLTFRNFLKDCREYAIMESSLSWSGS